MLVCLINAQPVNDLLTPAENPFSLILVTSPAVVSAKNIAPLAVLQYINANRVPSIVVSDLISILLTR